MLCQEHNGKPLITAKQDRDTPLISYDRRGSRTKCSFTLKIGKQFVYFWRLLKVKGVDFDEGFLAQLISNYFIQSKNKNRPKLSDALAIYLNESTAGDGVIVP